MTIVRTPVGTRLLDKVDIFSSDLGCWLWMAAKNPDGYGRIGVTGSFPHLAHRLAYSIFVGPIPAGYQVDHLCNVPACINPRHLEAVTGTENNRRRQLRRTHCPSGHPWDEANTRWTAQGWRMCRACARDAAARQRAKRRERTSA